MAIGIDIEEVKRFREKPYGENLRFYEKIFTGGEISYCLEQADPYPHFTARFCAKEAVMKALGTPMDFRKVEITKNEAGAPRAAVEGAGNVEAAVSLSHTKEYAAAVAVTQALYLVN